MQTTPAAAAATRLIEAAETRTPCAPVRDLIGRDDQAAAYAVQQLVTQRRMDAGARLCGRKIGLTSEAVQRQLGVDQPDFGVLFEDMMYVSGVQLPHDEVLQPRVEAELAFVLDEDLADGPLDAAQVRRATAYVAPALEVCGSRIAGWDISFADTVADNASAGAVVLGDDAVKLDEISSVHVEMTLWVNGVEASIGTGSACLGDPVNAVVWLARVAREVGNPLRAGEVVMSGALGPMVALSPGSRATAIFPGLGAITMSLTEGAQQ